MRESTPPKPTSLVVACVSAMLLMLGSIMIAAPSHAVPEKDETPQSAHEQKGEARNPGPAPAPRGSHAAAPGGSAVNLPRPNDFQAQADPDGLENGGVDQPGGAGGVDATTQDGNNGSGNDTDCEDDNRGKGVPGHCKDRPAAATPPLPGKTPLEPGAPVLVDAGQVMAPLVIETTAGSSLVSSAMSGAGPTTTTTTAPASSVSPARATTAPGVLPNTGAGQTLVGLAIAALAALALGTGLVRRGRGTAAAG